MINVSAWRDRLDDAMNPVLLKELRQAVRGRFVVTALVLSLLAEVITIASMYVADELSKFRLDSRPVGPQTFAALFGVIVFACMLFVPFYCGMRMAAERSDQNIDLMYVTTIAPRTVVIGKMLAVMAFVSLLFGATLPFLSFAYVLRGLDLWPCVLSVVIALLLITSEAAFALFLGALPLSRPFKILLALFLFVVLTLFSRLLLFGGTTSVLGPMLASSMPSGPTPGAVRVVIISTIVTFLIIDAIFMVLTTAILTPPPANRALPIRVMLSGLWLITLGVAIRATLLTKISGPMEFWAWTQICFIALVMLSAVGEREEWGKRVARTIPRSSLLRPIAFLFYSGSGGGLLWCAAMLMATLLAFFITGNVFVMNDLRTSTYGYVPLDLFSTMMQLASACMAMLAYGLTAVRVHRRFFARRIPRKNTWAIVATLLIIFGVLLPLGATLRFVKSNDFQKVFEWSITLNPFAQLRDPSMAMTRFMIVSIWLALVSLGSLPWLLAQWRKFRRSESVTPAAQTSEPIALQELASE